MAAPDRDPDSTRPPAGEPPAVDIPEDILRLAEAFIFASPEPVTEPALAPLLPGEMDPVLVLAALQRHCAGRGVVLVETGQGWSFRTAADLAAPLRAALAETRRLPRVAMETLVVIALHQPVTRAEIEQIRGVSLSQASMDVLLQTGLIQPWGRKDVAGRPTLWVTTPRFLAQFGLNSLRELPGAERFRPRPAAAGQPAGAAAAAQDGSAAASGDGALPGPEGASA